MEPLDGLMPLLLHFGRVLGGCIDHEINESCDVRFASARRFVRWNEDRCKVVQCLELFGGKELGLVSTPAVWFGRCERIFLVRERGMRVDWGARQPRCKELLAPGDGRSAENHPARFAPSHLA